MNGEIKTSLEQTKTTKVTPLQVALALISNDAFAVKVLIEYLIQLQKQTDFGTFEINSKNKSLESLCQILQSPSCNVLSDTLLQFCDTLPVALRKAGLSHRLRPALTSQDETSFNERYRDKC